MKKALLPIFLFMSSLTAITLGGCKRKEKFNYDPDNFLPNGTPENPWQIVKEPVTIKIFAPHSAGNPEYKDLKMFKKISEMTNLQFEFNTPDTAAYSARRTTVWEDKNYKPDIFLYSNSLSEQVQNVEYGYKMFVPFNDPTFVDANDMKIGSLLDNHMPVLKNLIDTNFGINIEQENCRKIITLDDGKIYATPQAGDVGRDLTYKFFINNVWIKNVFKKNPSSFCKLNGIDDASKIDTIE